jgi:prohibitin 2
MFTLIVTVIAIAAFVGFRKGANHVGKKDEIYSYLKVASVVSLILSILIPLGVGFYSTFRTIPPGNVGVTTLFGAVRSSPLPEGFNVTLPLVEVTNMSVQLQKHTATYIGSTKDMQIVHVDMVLNFRLEADKAPAVFQQTGSDYVNIVVDPAAQEVLKAETANHDAGDLLKNRPKVKDAVQKNLAVWLEKYHIKLEEVAIANIKFEPVYEHAIEQKQVQQQVAAQRQYELEQAQKEAEIAAAKAKGLADSRMIQAEGEAIYNQKVSASITPEIIKMEYLKRWDGKLPNVLSGKDNMLFTLDTSKQVDSEKK